MEFSGLILFRVCSTSGICRFMSLANLGKFEAVIFFEYFSVLLFSWTRVIQVLCLSYILQVPRRTARHGCRRQPGLSRAQGGRGNHSEYVDSVWLSLKLSKVPSTENSMHVTSGGCWGLSWVLWASGGSKAIPSWLQAVGGEFPLAHSQLNGSSNLLGLLRSTIRVPLNTFDLIFGHHYRKRHVLQGRKIQIINIKIAFYRTIASKLH